MLRSAAGLLTGAVGIGSVAADTPDEPPEDAGVQPEAIPADEKHALPQITTRGHFSTTVYREVQLNDGYGPTEYELDGSIPGLTTAEQPDELVIFVHGWLNDDLVARGSFWLFEQALRANGYEQPMVGYSWDSDTLLTRWWQATEIAERNGKKLASFVTDYAEAVPGTDIRLVCHSLGSKVALGALREELADSQVTVASTSLMGAAVGDQEVSVGGRYGDAISEGTLQLDNYYNTGDWILSNVYEAAEWDTAVGSSGATGTTPSNYSEHEVTEDVIAHVTYFQPVIGCVEQVVSQF